MTSGASTDLEVVRAFVNTLDVEENTDALTDPPALRSWFVDRGLLPPDSGELDRRDLDGALRLRGALRGLLQANHDRAPADPGDLTVLNAIAARSPVRLEFSADGVDLTPAEDGPEHAFSGLLVRIAQAMADGTWRRLKVCLEDSCQWAFYDESRNRSGKWCSMEVCGNRAKARAFRERHAGG